MPLPKPTKKENEEEFVSRCMGDDIMVEEYKNPKQRSAICYTQFKQRLKSKGKVSWNDVRKGDSLNLI